MATEQSELRLRYVHGHIKNNYAPLSFTQSHDWSGNVVGQYPQTIESGDTVQFQHDGTRSGPDGSKGAVVYTNPGHFRNSFLVAWWRSVRFAKVHVELGPQVGHETNWSEIEEKLNASGQESTAFSGHMRTGATAKIGFDGKLEVTFGGVPLPAPSS